MSHFPWRRPLAIIAALLTLFILACTDAAPTPAATPAATPLASPEAPTPVVAPLSHDPTPTAPSTDPGAAGPSSPALEGTALVGECQLRLELAETPEERARGLMERSSLPQDRGMLFIYTEETLLRFWMRATLIPLDILFLDSTGRVVDMQTMVPEPGVAPELLRVYTSAAPARYGLEVNAGVASACGVKVGDLVTLTLE